MKEKKYSTSPLDLEEDEPESDILQSHRSRVWFYMEWIPITLLSIGILLRQQGNYLWKYLIIGGGISAALIYLLFSTVLLKAEKSSRVEMALSVISGLLLSMGIVSLIADFLFWESADSLLRITLYSGIGMVLVVGFFFLIHIRQPEYTRFYRDLLARLLIFIALIYSLGF